MNPVVAKTPGQPAAGRLSRHFTYSESAFLSWPQEIDRSSAAGSSSEITTLAADRVVVLPVVVPVLLVPAVVNAETSYQDAWTRSQRVIGERILPLARDLKVVIGIEEVWNKFLLSPLEMARYVD